MTLTEALECYRKFEITSGQFCLEVIDHLPYGADKEEELRSLLAGEPELRRVVADWLFHVAHSNDDVGGAERKPIVLTPTARYAAGILASALDPEWVERAWAVEIERRAEEARSGKAQGLSLQETRDLMAMGPEAARAWVAARKNEPSV